jgi:multiple sugar transport system substrate-binding protein
MRNLLPIILVAGLIGCTSPPTSGTTAVPEATATPIVEQPLQMDKTPPPQSGPTVIKLWVPPEIDPANGSPEGDILQARLDEFTDRRPNIRIEIRVKQVDGPGGILDTLTTATAAAPLALPDLVALPGQSLETAAINGLLHPFDELTDTMKSDEWYDFAQSLAHIEDTIIGIPFAGDALITVLRPSIISNQIDNWTSSLELTSDIPVVMSFPAADPFSLFTLLLYQSIDGLIMDSENRPTLEVDPLIEVLTYYQEAEQSGLMPFWLTQYETDDQSWTVYEENQTDYVITWASRYLKNPPVDSKGALIPTRDGNSFTLATGWAWALVNSDPSRQEISVQLAEFLTTGDFLGEWTAALGYIPPRSDALTGWDNVSTQMLLSKVAPAAQLIASQDVLTALGPPLQTATISILKEQENPISAADKAVEMLIQP